MPQLVLIRHGQSLWNAQNRFTGWEDIDLSPQGEFEAQKAGLLLIQKKINFDVAYTSLLKRAVRTLWIILREMDAVWLPVHKSWRLNERHYGSLQGLNKKETASKYGEDQVFKWRRSYTLSPPLSQGKENQKKMFQNISIPKGESLAQTAERVKPLWVQQIKKQLCQNKNVLVTAHGNSLRALIKHIKKLSEEDILKLEVPTAKPIHLSWKNTSVDQLPDVFEFL